MRREQELVHGNNAADAVATIDQDAKIARQRSRIAGDRHDFRDFGCGKLLGLSRCSRPRRIEHDGIIGRELLWPERGAEQVASEGSDWLELGRLAPSLGESGKRGLVGFEGVDRSGSRQGKGEGAKTGKQVGNTLGSTYPFFDKAGQRCFGLS